MEQLELDEEYLLPLVEPEDMSEMFSGIIERLCKPQKLDEDEYLGMLIDYLIYINSRDKIGKIYIMVSSRLKDTKTIMSIISPEEDKAGLIEINPDEKSFFKFFNYYNLFDMINALEHEISHGYEKIYLPSTYLKFVCEGGKDAYMTSGVPKLFSDLFKKHKFENCAFRWGKAQYFSMHSEQFARRRAEKNTKTIFLKMIEFAKTTNLPPSQISKIVHGYVRHEREMHKSEQERMSFAKSFFAGKEKVDGYDITNVRKAWDNLIDKVCRDELLSLEHMDEEKVGIVKRHFGLVIELCNLKIFYNQANFDKLFAWQIGKEQLNLDLLMRIICQKNNTKSRVQLNQLKHIAKARKQEECLKTICKKLFEKPKEVAEINISTLEK